MNKTLCPTERGNALLSLYSVFVWYQALISQAPAIFSPPSAVFPLALGRALKVPRPLMGGCGVKGKGEVPYLTGSVSPAWRPLNVKRKVCSPQALWHGFPCRKPGLHMIAKGVGSLLRHFLHFSALVVTVFEQGGELGVAVGVEDVVQSTNHGNGRLFPVQRRTGRELGKMWDTQGQEAKM